MQRRRFSLLPLLAALALFLPLAAPVAATPGETSLAGLVEQDGLVEIAVAGNSLDKYEVGDIVPLDEIARAEYGLVDTAPGPVLQAGPPDQYNIATSWRDPLSALVIVRMGYYSPPNSGFGWRKAHYKHDLGNGATKTITMKYFIREPSGGQSIRYRTTMKHLLCLSSGCYVADELTARAIVDFKTWDTTSFGLVTAHCEGYEGKCPYWVKDAR